MENALSSIACDCTDSFVAPLAARESSSDAVSAAAGRLPPAGVWSKHGAYRRAQKKPGEPGFQGDFRAVEYLKALPTLLVRMKVEDNGLEPMTFCMPCRRSPN